MFCNELELLDVKLQELYPYVDRFVIVESVETHQGYDKPLYFELNKERYAPFLDKITHIIVDVRLITEDPWDRERFQRDEIMKGLLDCNDQDIIIIEDADEIVRGEAIPFLVSTLMSGQEMAVAFEQEMHYWFLNVYDKAPLRKFGRYWQGSVACSYHTLKQYTPTDIRSLRFTLPCITDGGWHFSYMGGSQRVVNKVDYLMCHTREEFYDVFHKTIDEVMNKATDFIVVPIDEDYPEFIRSNIPYFTEIGFIYTD